MVVLLLSPIVIIFAVPLAIGIGLDIFDVAGETPVALALCTPVVLMSIGVLAATPARQLIAARLRASLPLGRAAELGYAPKSITRRRQAA